MSLTAESVSLVGQSPQVYRGGSGPTVVWLHAAGGVVPGDPTIDALAARYSVVAPVAPGFNDLDELNDINDVHDLAIHYDDLFESLGLEGVPVIGHSFGGMIAAELAAHYPNRVSKLVLVAPVGLWHDDYPVADLFAIPFTEINDLLWGDQDAPAAQMARAMAENSDAMAGGDPEAYVEMLVALAKGFTAVGKFMWPIPDKGLSRRLRRIQAETLVIFGDKDALVPARYADDFVAGIPNARKAIVAGAGHMLPLERPEEFQQLVTDFLG